MIVLTLLSLVPSLVAGWILSPNFGWLLMAALTGSYMFYELVHFSCHVNDNWLIRNTPIINTARRHHTAHHDHPLMMEVNMGIGTLFLIGCLEPPISKEDFGVISLTATARVI